MSESVQLPEWVATLIGRLTLENEAMRRMLAEAETPRASDLPEAQVADMPIHLDEH